MFYETAQTIGPGWHRSYKPSHYEDMTWSPSTRHQRSPGSSPETYRRIIHTEDDFPKRTKEDDEEFFRGHRSPTFPRRIFKEVWNESPPNHRFGERPRLFKRVFKPGHWDEEFDRDIPHMRRVEKPFDHDFDDNRPMSRNFDDEFEKRFNARDLHKDIEEEFQKAEGRVHHIPIMVEKRMDGMKSRFGKNSPPSERANEEEYAEDWVGPQVQNLKKTFEPNDEFSSRYAHRFPRVDMSSRPRAFTNPASETWDPHAIHTLPIRKSHKNFQSFDDSRHPLPPKSVFRSYSETHEDVPRQQPQHSAAFRSHSDGHCPKQTYVTKIEVNLPSEKEKEELRSKYSGNDKGKSNIQHDQNFQNDPNEKDSNETTEQIPDSGIEPQTKPKIKVKYDSPSLQQIAAVLQNIEDLVPRVDAYNGTGRDKQYRFLDEMLTRCMLRLDDVDTEGREDIRSARKAAVREVQFCIDKLEAKADESERRQQEKDSSSQVDESENKDNTPEQNVGQSGEENEFVEQKENEQETSKEDVTKNGDNEQTKL